MQNVNETTPKKQIQVIEVINPFIDSITNEVIRKKRVAAYARVSTNELDQMNSYENQIKEYTTMINENPDWEFAGMYADKGISGTSLKNRVQFNEMITAALNNHIDLIITKSISRFSRNTVDILSIIQKLREKRVEIYFEKENIYGSDPKLDFLITIMSSIAQEESRSISSNVSWGYRKGFKEGRVNLNTSSFLGYVKDKDGNLVINEQEASTVRLIYSLFLEGHSIQGIVKILNNEKIPTVRKKYGWQYNGVKSILSNEKYCGDALLQKCVTMDYLTHRSIRNDNILPKYYVSNSHPGIVDKETFHTAQILLKGLNEKEIRQQTKNPLTNFVFCSSCGCAMKRHYINVGRPSKRTILDCNHANKKLTKCTNKTVDEDIVSSAVNDLIHSFIKNKGLLTDLKGILMSTFENTAEKELIESGRVKMDQLNLELKTLIESRISSNTPDNLFKEKYNEKITEIKSLQIELDNANNEISKKAIMEYQTRIIDTLLNEQRAYELPSIYKSIFKCVFYTNQNELLFVISTNEDDLNTIISKAKEIINYQPFMEQNYFNPSLRKNIYIKVVLYGSESNKN